MLWLGHVQSLQEGPCHEQPLQSTLCSSAQLCLTCDWTPTCTWQQCSFCWSWEWALSADFLSLNCFQLLTCTTGCIWAWGRVFNAAIFRSLKLSILKIVLYYCLYYCFLYYSLGSLHWDCCLALLFSCLLRSGLLGDFSELLFHSVVLLSLRSSCAEDAVSQMLQSLIWGGFWCWSGRMQKTL